MSRLPKGGLIDRNKPLNFRFNGKNFDGFQGDTLASALLANDQKLVGRSFKYHRPRGIMTAGSDEPNALMTLERSDGQLPNTRATVQELYDGLTAQSQHAWPSLHTDFGRSIDYFRKFLGPGFYTKTFMWPRDGWRRFYEPLIRHGAGLGKLPTSPDAALFTKSWAHCDLLVIGGGLAGIMAALVAGEAGARVILANDDFAFGGRALSETYQVDGRSGHVWVKEQIAKLAEMGNVRLMPRTAVVGAHDGATYAAVERISDHIIEAPENVPRQVFWRIVARRVILATGAEERMIAFPGNDLPGVMLSGAVRSYVTRFGVAPAKKVAIFTNNNDGWRTARDLDLAQVEIVAVIDTRPGVDPKVATARVVAGGEVIATEGRTGLQGITVRSDAGTEKLAVDCLAVSGGWNPAIQLSGHLGSKPNWNEDISAFVAASDTIEELSAIGAAAGKFSSHAALLDGQTEAVVALFELGFEPPTLRLPKAEDGPVEITPFWHVQVKGRAWLDFQNDVTVDDILQAQQENLQSADLVKRYTALGMGTDQGRMGALSASSLLSEPGNDNQSPLNAPRFRAPVTPVQMGAFGAGGAGQSFALARKGPVQKWIELQNAAMVEVGLWHCPSYYPKDGERHWRQSVDREAISVRQTVGVCDYSTVGKIDVQGRDAQTFLNRVFCNDILSLAPGRLRYGLILRDDGFAMTDAVCARLANSQYLLTTGTTDSEKVLTHLEFCAQCLWSDLEVLISDLSEQWAQIAVAGPQSRAVLAGFNGSEHGADSLPFMHCAQGTYNGVTAKLSRVSYTGDLGYEVMVPAGYGVWAMAELVAEAEALGGGAVGLEAWDVLRMEAGYLGDAELNGQTTAGDLGMGHMLPLDKHFIGKSAGQRSGLNGPKRQQLIGLRPSGAVKKISAGAHLLEPGADKVLENSKGYVTSACYSPNLGCVIALALMENGRARVGSRVLAVDAVRETETLCEIVAHQEDNPGKERQRATS